MKSSPWRFSVKIGLSGAVVVGTLMFLAICDSTSSTAAIGFIFLPFYCIIAFVGFFCWGWSVGYLWNWFMGGQRRFGVTLVLALIIGVPSSVLLIKETGEGLILTGLTFRIGEMRSDEDLREVLDYSWFRNNKFVLGAMAQNPCASSELLDCIARRPDPELHERMGSALFPLTKGNGKGLAVMRLVALNPHVSPETLEYLAANSMVDYVLGTVAGNPKTSKATLSRLASKSNYLIDWGLAGNPETPPDVFGQLLERKKDFAQRTTLDILTRNPAISSDVRERAEKLLKEY